MRRQDFANNGNQLSQKDKEPEEASEYHGNHGRHYGHNGRHRGGHHKGHHRHHQYQKLFEHEERHKHHGYRHHGGGRHGRHKDHDPLDYQNLPNRRQLQNIYQRHKQRERIFKNEHDLTNELKNSLKNQSQPVFANNKSSQKQIPEGLLCPISQDLMIQPVMITVCGHTFEQTIIKDWFKKSPMCPLCKKQADQTKLQKNFVVFSLIEKYK